MLTHNTRQRPAILPIVTQEDLSSMSAARTALQELKEGAFVRTAAGYRSQIKPGTTFEPEPNRYHL